MFIGHFAVGFAAKRVEPKLNLGVLFIACQLLDLIWPVLVLLGIEKVGVDHAATVSHWILDFLTHRPDLPIGPSEVDKVGLGLWNSLPATLVVEGALFAFGVYLYLKTQTGVSKGRRYATYGLIAFLTLIYAGNVLGPKPPLDTPAAALAGPALAMWLLVLWGYAVDRK